MKQDMNGVRTAQDLERKYNLGEISIIKEAVERQEVGLTNTNQELVNFINSTTENLQELQDQVDGNITTWFFNGVPTTENEPAKDWTTEEKKINHLGDLYYDQDTGYAYRWASINNTFEWNRIIDADVTEALAIANAAQDTADSKRRVFVVQPTIPYDVGDIWIRNDSDLYRCSRSRETGEFDASDWVIATKYTDDTAANNAYALADSVKTDLETNYVTNSTLESTTDGINASVEAVSYRVDTKNRVFTTTPSIPYSVGDIYIMNDKVYVCRTTKNEGQYDPNDFELDIDATQFASKAEVNIERDRITSTVTSVNNLESQFVTNKIVKSYPIEIEDAGNYNLAENKVYGNSYQDHEPTPSNPSEIKNVGVVNLFDKDSVSVLDGYYFNTNTGANVQGGNSSIIDTFMPIKPNTTYTLSSSNIQKICFYQTNNASSFISTIVETTTRKTFTTPNNANYYRFQFATSEKNLDSIMLEEGTIAHSYVPYGNYIVEKTRGKNLFDKSKVTNGKYVNSTNGELASGTSTYNASDFINVNTGNYIWGETSSTGYHLCTYDKDKKFIRAIGRIDTKPINIIITNNEKYVRFTVVNNDLNTLQLEEGSTATSYEPYKENKIIVSLNKENLFDEQYFYYKNTLNTNGISSYETRSAYYLMPVKPNTTYSFSSNINDISGIFVYKQDKTYKTAYQGGWGKEKVITTASDEYYIGIVIKTPSDTAPTLEETKSDIKIYEGVTPYYELNKIGDIQDELNIKTGVLTRRIGKVVLDGSESWGINSVYTNNSRFTCNNDNYILTPTTNLLSSHFVEGTGGTDTVNIDTNGSSGRIMITIPNTIANTVSALTTWLSNNNVTVYYILEEPETIQLTKQELELFENYNYITVDVEVEPSDFEVNYLTNNKLANYQNTVEMIQTDLQAQINVTNDIKENGVSRVKTTTGFTFAEDGLTITKTSANTKTNVNEDGMIIYSTSGSQQEEMLNVNNEGMEAYNIKVKTYFNIGSHSRMEDYQDGTGIFYIG